MTWQDVIELGLGICLFYVVCRYYWLRVIFSAVILFIWTLFSIAAPLYFAWDDLVNGNIVLGIFTIVISSVIAVPCCIALYAAWSWAKNEFPNNRPWNAE